MAIVKLIQKDQNVLTVEGIDILDKSPLIGIKPYIRSFDLIEDATDGWVAKTKWRPKPESR